MATTEQHGHSLTTKLEEQKEELEKQLKEVEVNFHRISGALALIEQLLKEIDKND